VTLRQYCKDLSHGKKILRCEIDPMRYPLLFVAILTGCSEGSSKKATKREDSPHVSATIQPSTADIRQSLEESLEGIQESLSVLSSEIRTVEEKSQSWEAPLAELAEQMAALGNNMDLILANMSRMEAQIGQVASATSLSQLIRDSVRQTVSEWGESFMSRIPPPHTQQQSNGGQPLMIPAHMLSHPKGQVAIQTTVSSQTAAGAPPPPPPPLPHFLSTGRAGPPPPPPPPLPDFLSAGRAGVRPPRAPLLPECFPPRRPATSPSFAGARAVENPTEEKGTAGEEPNSKGQSNSDSKKAAKERFSEELMRWHKKRRARVQDVDEPMDDLDKTSASD
jgi:hypothetical protein